MDMDTAFWAAMHSSGNPTTHNLSFVQNHNMPLHWVRLLLEDGGAVVKEDALKAAGVGVLELDYINVFVGSLVVGVAMGISLWLRLQLELKLFIAIIRCIAQLSLLGYILVPIFQHNSWYVVLGYASFMLLVAAAEASSRPAFSYKGLLLNTFLGLGGAATFTLGYAVLLVVRTDPWYDARYFIPLLGMLLGTAVSGVSIGLTTIMEELSHGKDRVEVLLALGATRMEASRAVLQRAMLVALQPVLNQMSVVGLVSIPGMMAGQVLAGGYEAILQAARYQMIILFLITSTTGLGAMSAVLGTLMRVIDSDHCLHSSRLLDKGGKGQGINGAIQWTITKVIATVAAAGIAIWRLLTHLGSCCSKRRHTYLSLPTEDDGPSPDISHPDEQTMLGVRGVMTHSPLQGAVVTSSAAAAVQGGNKAVKQHEGSLRKLGDADLESYSSTGDGHIVLEKAKGVMLRRLPDIENAVIDIDDHGEHGGMASNLTIDHPPHRHDSVLSGAGDRADSSEVTRSSGDTSSAGPSPADSAGPSSEASDDEQSHLVHVRQ